MKKLIALIAVLTITSIASYGATMNLGPVQGQFTATFYCLPTLTGPAEASPISLGNYFVTGAFVPVNAGGPYTFTWTAAGNSLMGFVFTGVLASSSATADVQATWASGAWSAVATVAGGAVTSPTINPPGTSTGPADCSSTFTVTATATDVLDATAEAVTYTATLSAVVTI